MIFRAKAVVFFLVTILASTWSVARAANLGNLTYRPEELNKAVSLFNTQTNLLKGPGGVDTVLVVHGYLVVQGSFDSGKAGGAFHVFDISDPRNPKLMKTYSSPATESLAEWHMAGMAKVDGKDILVNRDVAGIAFFDFTDPLNPKDVSKLALPGVGGGDYTNASWMSTWSWPYVYTSISGAGVAITDATDPSNPKLVKQIPTGQMGNFRVGPLAIAGNYLVVTNMDQAPFRASVIDVSDPRNPALVNTVTGPDGLYSAVVIGDMVFGGGEGGRYTFAKWSATGTKIVATKSIGKDKGGYCTYQDGFGFCGQSSEGYHKLDLRDLDNIQVAGTGRLADGGGGDYDFATVIGNLVFQGNDHGGSNGLLVHQVAPDTTPPAVVKIYPEDQSTRNAFTSHVTVFFSDEIDTDTVSSTSIIVRKTGGTALDGVYSHSSTNAISFGPRQPLEANSTYEVVVVAGGVKDLAGNALTQAATIRFATGDHVGPGTDGGAAAGGTDGGSVATGTGGVTGAGGTGTSGTGGSSKGTGVGSGAAGGGTAGSAGAGGAAGANGSGGPRGGDTGLGSGGTGQRSTLGAGGAGGGGSSQGSGASGCEVAGPGRRGALLFGFAIAMLFWGGRRLGNRRDRRNSGR